MKLKFIEPTEYAISIELSQTEARNIRDLLGRAQVQTTLAPESAFYGNDEKAITSAKKFCASIDAAIKAIEQSKRALYEGIAE